MTVETNIPTFEQYIVSQAETNPDRKVDHQMGWDFCIWGNYIEEYYPDLYGKFLCPNSPDTVANGVPDIDTELCNHLNWCNHRETVGDLYDRLVSLGIINE